MSELAEYLKLRYFATHNESNITTPAPRKYTLASRKLKSRLCFFRSTITKTIYKRVHTYLLQMLRMTTSCFYTSTCSSDMLEIRS